MTIAAPVASATLIGPDQVRVTWTPVIGASDYLVQRSDEVNPTVVASTNYVQTIPFESALTFAVQARGSTGEVSVRALTNAVASSPLPATNASVSPVTGSLNVQWVDQSNTESGFLVERRLLPGSFAQVAVLASNSTSYLDTAALPGASYEYRVTSLSSVTTSSYPTATPQVAFPYPGAPTINAISHDCLLAAGGETVTIQGTNFGVGTTVTVGGVAGTQVTVLTKTSLTFRAPANASPTTKLPVAVTNPLGTATQTNAVEYFRDYYREEFSGPGFDGRFEDPGANFVVSGGKLRRATPGSTPVFFRTKQKDFLIRDYRYEVSVTMPSQPATIYVGMGSTTPAAAIGSAPQNSFGWRIRWLGASGVLEAFISSGTQFLYGVAGNIPGGTHRFQITQADEVRTSSYDLNFNGTFTAEGTGFYNRGHGAPDLSPTETHLFVGTTLSSHDFDDFSFKDLTIATPRIVRCLPRAGSLLGGDSVTLTGVGLSTPGTPTTVTVEGAPAANVVVLNDSTITFDTPPSSNTSNSLQVSNGNGSSPVNLGAWSYLRHSFTADFNSLEYDPDFSYPGTQMEPRSGGLMIPANGSVSIASTVLADYASRTFEFVGDLTWGSPLVATKAYFGIGRGTGAPGEPTNAVYLRMSITVPREIDLVVDGGPGTVLNFATLPAGGRHRCKVERNAAGIMIFSIDFNYAGGAFSADVSQQITTPTFLPAGDSKLLFGATGDIVFWDTFEATSP